MFEAFCHASGINSIIACSIGYPLAVKSSNALSKQAESEYKVLFRKKWEYYSGKAPPSVYQEKPFDLKVLKQDLPTYLESDEDLIQAKHKVDYHNSMCDYAESICKMMNNRGFQIKNAIDWKRFLEGSF